MGESGAGRMPVSAVRVGNNGCMTVETVTFPSILDPANSDRARQHLEDYYGLRLHPRPDLGWRKSRSALESPLKKGSDMSVFGFVGAYYDRLGFRREGESYVLEL